MPPREKRAHREKTAIRRLFEEKRHIGGRLPYITEVAEEEQPAPLQRSPHRAAVLILVEFSFFCIEEPARIENFVAEEFVSVPMKVVCTALSNNVDNGP